jgi:hypothetical protein
MRNNATFVDGQQLKFLQELDKWILKQKWKDSTEYETAVEVRTLITKIEKQGYYYEGEADLLNELRIQYIRDKKNTTKKRL